MTNGLFSDVFVQAEIDFRRNRAIAWSRPRLRPVRFRRHRRGLLGPRVARPRTRPQAMLD